LNSGDFATFNAIVAFSKEAALARLKDGISSFRRRGGCAQIVFGVDLLGTSKQAIEFALANFDAAYVWHHPSLFTTFHPKLYLFEGPRKATAIFGSNNLTVGGIETNCEAAVRIEHRLPDENAAFEQASRAWTEVLDHPNLSALTPALLATLDSMGLLADENAAVARLPGPRLPKARASGSRPMFPSTPIKAPSPSPSPRMRPRRPPAAAGGARRGRVAPAAVPPVVPQSLVIQIVPHHNGEIFLSKRAVDQHPAFFGFPFTGQTVPKVASNRPYPQRTPDPLTHWTIYDRRGTAIRSLPNYSLNTVFYDRKGEIRITVPPDAARAIPAGSILLMSRGPQNSGLDYVCDVHPPRARQHAALLAVCTETMPSGGAAQARRFGWI
jgi:hypothetical protein